ncbi:tyrosine-type recombinase/integrase [Thioclava sp.]|uniref:tyrosine-type recombinase/integrase n=1 Tax=Thioclava sp. TaxID=1933450 RepID=UPI003AA99E48
MGKSYRLKGASLDRLVAASEGQTISAATQRRTVGQVSHFLDWAVYEGQLTSNPFATVRVEAKSKPRHYEALSDGEVTRLLALKDGKIGVLFTLCLLTGMRAGEASGLVWSDLVWKENLGWFIWIRPNEVRSLKTEAAERFIPLHSAFAPMLDRLPKDGRLFPGLSVNTVTKRFAILREWAGITRQGVVFHSTRKWFVTQCERAGVPEHFTASIVGHQSARSENRMTYGIYSAGISDEQKREIVEKVGLPT